VVLSEKMRAESAGNSAEMHASLMAVLQFWQKFF